MHRRLHGAVLLLGWLLAAVGGGGGGQPGLGTMMLLGAVVRAAATPVPTPVPSAEGCYANEVLLDFFAANVTVNNLGGVGPNAGEDEELRYSKIGVVDGEDIDLVVTTTGEGGTYETESPERNGKSGKFGQLNMQVDTSMSCLLHEKRTSQGSGREGGCRQVCKLRCSFLHWLP